MANDVKAVPADQQRTEITPTPFSAMDDWALNTNDQEMLSNLLNGTSGRFLAAIREFALGLARSNGASGDFMAGVQEGARSLVEEILNMTKERASIHRANLLKRQAQRVGIGMPKSRRLREVPPLQVTRLSGPPTRAELEAIGEAPPLEPQ